MVAGLAFFTSSFFSHVLITFPLVGLYIRVLVTPLSWSASRSDHGGYGVACSGGSQKHYGVALMRMAWGVQVVQTS